MHFLHATISRMHANKQHLYHCVHFKPAKEHGNRLAPLAIKNKQATIKGMPKVPEEEAKAIARATLRLKGIVAVKKLKKHKEGNLRLMPRPLKYKSTTEVLRRIPSSAQKRAPYQTSPSCAPCPLFLKSLISTSK